MITLKQLSNRDYHADPAIGSTSIRNFLKDPVKFMHNREHGIKVVLGDGASRGTGVHSLLSGTFSEECVISPEFNLRTKDGRKDFAQFEMQYRHHTILTPSEYETVKWMHSALCNSPHYREFANSVQEEAAFFTCPITGMDLKVKWDGRKPMQVKELKCLAPLDYPYEKSWGKRMWDWGYDIQFALYSYAASLLEKCRMQDIEHKTIIVESAPPYLVHCFITSVEWLELGARRKDKALVGMKDALDWGVSVTSTTKPVLLPPPEKWMQREVYGYE